MLELVSSDSLNVPSEEEVYRAVLSWVKHDVDTRRQHVPRVRQDLRPPTPRDGEAMLWLKDWGSQEQSRPHMILKESPECWCLRGLAQGLRVPMAPCDHCVHPQLMKCVRLPLLSRDFLLGHVDAESLVRHHPDCKDLLIEALKFHLLPEQRGVLGTSRTRPRRCEGAGPVLFAVGMPLTPYHPELLTLHHWSPSPHTSQPP